MPSQESMPGPLPSQTFFRDVVGAYEGYIAKCEESLDMRATARSLMEFHDGMKPIEFEKAGSMELLLISPAERSAREPFMTVQIELLDDGHKYLTGWYQERKQQYEDRIRQVHGDDADRLIDEEDGEYNLYSIFLTETGPVVCSDILFDPDDRLDMVSAVSNLVKLGLAYPLTDEGQIAAVIELIKQSEPNVESFATEFECSPPDG